MRFGPRILREEVGLGLMMLEALRLGASSAVGSLQGIEGALGLGVEGIGGDRDLVPGARLGEQAGGLAGGAEPAGERGVGLARRSRGPLGQVLDRVERLRGL